MEAMAALKSMRIMVAAMGMVAASGSLAAQDRIEPASFLPNDEYLPRVVTIREDRGGHVILYALRMREWLEKGTQVRFAGKCQSACTLYLGLSQEQTCISDGASFGFHSPYGVSGRKDRVAFAGIRANSFDRDEIDRNPFFCPDAAAAAGMDGPGLTGSGDCTIWNGYGI